MKDSRQTQKKKERQKKGHVYRRTDKIKDNYRDRQTDEQNKNKWQTDRQWEWQTSREHAEQQTDRKERQTYRQIEWQTAWQSDR